MPTVKQFYQLTLDKLKSNESKLEIGKEINKKFAVNLNPLIESFGEVENGIKDPNLSAYPKIITPSKVSIENIYSERSKINLFIFTLSVSLCLLSIGIMIYLGAKGFQNNNESSSINVYWGYISSVLSFIVGGILFWFFKKNENSILKIEGDIRFLSKLEGVTLIINNIEDDSEKFKLLKEVIKQLQ